MAESSKYIDQSLTACQCPALINTIKQTRQSCQFKRLLIKTFSSGAEIAAHCG